MSLNKYIVSVVYKMYPKIISGNDPTIIKHTGQIVLLEYPIGHTREN